MKLMYMSILWEGLGFVTLENEQVGIRVTAQDLVEEQLEQY